MLVIILLLAIGVFSLTNKIATLESSIQNVANAKTIEPIIHHGIDGKDGLSIKGDTGNKGEDGKDSQSTKTQETIIKEVPIVVHGKDGADGVSPPELEIQINPETGDLETKKSNYKFWTTLIPCNELKVSCVKDVITKPVEAL